jgi:large subunit ribosomal protein L10
MTRTEKEKKVKELKEEILRANSIILSDFSGHSVRELATLRSMCRERGFKYKVVKNTLFNLALEGTKHSFLIRSFKGQCGVTFGGDITIQAKTLAEFAKEGKKLQVKIGSLNGSIIYPEDISRISKLPGRDELLAQLVSGCQAPLIQMINILSSPIRGLVLLLGSICERKAEGKNNSLKEKT